VFSASLTSAVSDLRGAAIVCVPKMVLFLFSGKTLFYYSRKKARLSRAFAIALLQVVSPTIVPDIEGLLLTLIH